MPNSTDDLERLARLRDSGALTEEEFALQKQRLLYSESPVPGASESRRGLTTTTKVAIAGFVILMIMLAIYGWFRPGANQVPANERTGAAQTNGSAPIGNQGNMNEPVSLAEPTPTGSYSWATSTDVLGVTPEFLESRLGPARERSAFSRTFEVGGCRIFYTVERSAVRAFQAPVSTRCRPSLRGTVASTLRVSPTTTFGQIWRLLGEGEFRATQVEGFGNAADPTIELEYGGAHVDNFVRVSFSSTDAGDAFSLWANAIRARLGMSPDQPIDDYAPFQCVDNPPSTVGRALRNASVDSVTVGYLSTDGCNG